MLNRQPAAALLPSEYSRKHLLRAGPGSSLAAVVYCHKTLFVLNSSQSCPVTQCGNVSGCESASLRVTVQEARLLLKDCIFFYVFKSFKIHKRRLMCWCLQEVWSMWSALNGRLLTLGVAWAFWKMLMFSLRVIGSRSETAFILML